MNELEDVKQSIKKLDKQIQELKNQRYRLSESELILNKEESKKNVGRCFKRIDNNNVSYFKVMDISKETYQIRGGRQFNEHSYPTLMFKYPYDNSKCPFIEEDLSIYDKRIFISGFNDNGIYNEITGEEYMEKFKEINND